VRDAGAFVSGGKLSLKNRVCMASPLENDF